MRLSLQLALILGICFSGELLHRVGIPIPGNIIGMILLFILLVFKVVKPKQLEQSTRFFLKFLPIFFLPAGVGITQVYPTLKGHITGILIICILSTAFCIVVTGYSVQILNKITGEGSAPKFVKQKRLLRYSFLKMQKKIKRKRRLKK